MQNEDNAIQEYDILILKKNIKKLMDDNGITQEDIAGIINRAQSRVSICLDTSTTDCFTLCQVVDIATYFGISIDDLLGISPKKKESEDITLADIFQKLFELDEMIGLTIVEYQYPYERPSDPAIILHSKTICEKLVEWKQIQSIDLDDSTTKEKMIQLWKKDLLEDGNHMKKKDDFAYIPPDLDDLIFT